MGAYTRGNAHRAAGSVSRPRPVLIASTRRDQGTAGIDEGPIRPKRRRVALSVAKTGLGRDRHSPPRGPRCGESCRRRLRLRQRRTASAPEPGLLQQTSADDGLASRLFAATRSRRVATSGMAIAQGRGSMAFLAPGPARDQSGVRNMRSHGHDRANGAEAALGGPARASVESRTVGGDERVGCVRTALCSAHGPPGPSQARSNRWRGQPKPRAGYVGGSSGEQ